MKTKRIYFVLLVMLLVILTMTFVACTDPGLKDDSNSSSEIDGSKEIISADKDNPVSNGAFSAAYNSSTGKYVKKDTVTGWTSRTGSAVYYDADGKVNATTSFSMVQGVVDLSKWSEQINSAVYGSEPSGKSGTFGSISLPVNGNDYASEDHNALMIASDLSGTKTYRSSSYYYSNSVSIKAGKYYRLSIDVLTLLMDSEGNIVTQATDDLNEEQGAYIVITDSSSNSYVYNRVDAINTYGEWKTVTIDVCANTESDSTIGIQLWMGHGTSYVQGGTVNKHLTTGLVLFDNVVVEEQTNGDAYSQTKESVNEKVLGGDTSANYSFDIDGTYHFVNLADFGTIEKYGVYSYSSSSSSTSSYNYYYTARVGNPSAYTVMKGVEKSSNYSSSQLPYYSTSSYLPYGIFDYSKVWTYSTDADGNGSYTDTYGALNSAKLYSDWAAFPYADFYDADGNFDNHALKDLYTGYTDTNALTIYNYQPSGVGYKANNSYTIEQNGYYTVTVYAYSWQALKVGGKTTTGLSLSEVNTALDQIEYFNDNIDSYNAFVSLKDVTVADDTKNFTLNNYVNDLKAYLAEYKAKIAADEKISADIKALWASYDGIYTFPTEKEYYYAADSTSTSKYQVALGSVGLPSFSAGNWNEVKFQIKGNALGDRELGIEFWLGQGLSGTNTLTMGGLMIGDVVVTRDDAPVDTSVYKQLSSFEGDEYDIYGLTGTKENFDEYGFNLEYGADLYEESSVEATVSTPQAGEGIVIGDKTFKVIELNHSDYSASILTFAKFNSDDNVAVINPNKYYRLSISVKTAEDNYGSGTLQLISWNELSEQKRGSYTSLKNFSSIKSADEWTEYVFYISGAQNTNKVALQYLFGSGDAYSPSTHAKGSVCFTAATFVEVSYTEYNSENKGENVASYSFSYDYYTDGFLTNGRFTDVDYDDTQDDNKKNYGLDSAYNDQGDLIGIGTPNTGWTKAEASYQNTLAKPTVSFNSDYVSAGKTTLDSSKVSHSDGKDVLDLSGLNNVILYYADQTKFIESGSDHEEITNATDSAYTYQYTLTETYTFASTVPEAYTSYVVDGNKVYIPDLKTREALALTWTNKVEAEEKDYYDYEVWFVEKGNNSNDKYFLTTVTGTFNDGVMTYTYPVVSFVDGTYFVRAIPKASVAGIEGYEQSKYAPSDYASIDLKSAQYVTADGYVTAKSDIIAEYKVTVAITEEQKNTAPSEGTPSYNAGNVYSGIIDYETFDNSILGSLAGGFSNIYPKEGVNGYYRPADEKNNGVWSYGYSTDDYRTINGKYNNLLMLASDVNTIVGYTSSDKSLSAGKSYVVSFWVKTIGADTKASIVLSNKSGIFNGDFEGFNGISTNGEWIQYRIVIKVGFTDSKVKFGLYLGNPEGNKEYSNGIVLFDDIAVTELTEDEYDDYVTAKDGADLKSYETDASHLNAYNAAEKKVNYSNDFVYVALDYFTDSFDIHNDDAKNALGNTGGDYTQKMDTGDTDIDSSNSARAYGIYAQKDMTDADNFSYFISSSDSKYDSKKEDIRDQEYYKNAHIDSLDALKAYLVGFGDNVMMLANFKANAQYVQSTSKTLENESYYEISFYAKALTAAGKYAEFRLYESSSSKNYTSIRIQGQDEVTEDNNGYKLYTMYVKNDSGESKSAVMRFALGSGSLDADGNSGLMTGLLVVDKVSIVEIEESVYNTKVNTLKDLESSDKDSYKNGTGAYAEMTATEDKDTDDDEDEDTSSSGWGSQEWLILSSSVISFLLVAALVIYMVKVFKKKYVKKNKIESNVDPEKKDEVAIKQQKKENAAVDKKDRSEFED